MDQQGFTPKQMHPVDPPVPCSGCGTPISQLPFPPDPKRLNQLVCYDCYKAKKASYGR